MKFRTEGLLSSKEMQDALFDVLSKGLRGDTKYAFKGGYIVSNFLTNNMRATKDIDMSVVDRQTFTKVVRLVTPLLEKWKAEGQIFGYESKPPVIKGIKRNSGYVKMYRKTSDNTPKRKICGIDISEHNLTFGIVSVNDGVNVFSIERMLSDKLAVVFSTPKKLKKRCRDLYDIYLFDLISARIDIDVLKIGLEYHKIDIFSKSALEEMVQTDISELTSALEMMIKAGQRVPLNSNGVATVSPEVLISENLRILDLLRSWSMC